MPSIATATQAKLYDVAAKTQDLSLALSAYSLVRNPALVPSTDSAMTSAYNVIGSVVVPATSATVSNGDTAAVASSDGVTRTTGTYRVAGSTASGVLLPVGYTIAYTGQYVKIWNKSGSVSVDGKVNIIGNAFHGEVPATHALVPSGAMAVKATGTGTTVNITVVNGNVTAINLTT